MIKAGIIGGTGLVAGELLRILSQHPEVAVDFVYSHSQPNDKVTSVHNDLFEYENLRFTDKVNSEVDVVFLSLGHGYSKKFIEEHPFSNSTKIIDLSNDFRLQKDKHFSNKDFVYGLIELNKSKIMQAQHIANPGCFASAILMGLLPLAQAQWLKNDIHIHGITGATGAGNALSETSHFIWRDNNISIYKAFTHQHLAEIKESVRTLQTDFDKKLNFIPVRGDFSRGIFVSMYTTCEKTESELVQLFVDFYKAEPFVHISDKQIHLKQVVNTNHTLIHVQKFEDKVLITTAIDNLIKGAAGQAVQNLNLMFGFPEQTALNLKANYF